jgi:hypothetical protein
MKCRRLPAGALALALACASAAQTPPSAREADPGPVVDLNKGPDLFGEVSLAIASSRKTASGEARYGIDDQYFSLKLSGPFDESEGEVLLGDLDRLADAATAEIAFQKKWNDKNLTLRAGGRLGRPVFKFLDLSSNVVSTSREDANELFVRGEWLVERAQGVLVALTYRHGTAYEASPTRNICTPVPGTSAEECRNLATGAPTKIKSDTVAAELYYQNTTRFGIGIAVAQDFENDITGVELPIYLARDESSGLLSGGVKLSWQSDDDDLEALLFLSQPIGD